MSIQNNESEKRRKGKATRRFRKLIRGSDTHGAMLKDDPLTKLVARIIEAWIADGRLQTVLAKTMRVSPSNVAQLRARTLGVGGKVSKRIAASLGLSESELHRMAESAEHDEAVSVAPFVARLAGDKKAALPYAVPEEGLTVGERALYEEALRLLGEMRESSKMTAALRKSADDVVERAKALKGDPPPPTNSARGPKKAK